MEQDVSRTTLGRGCAIENELRRAVQVSPSSPRPSLACPKKGPLLRSTCERYPLLGNHYSKMKARKEGRKSGWTDPDDDNDDDIGRAQHISTALGAPLARCTGCVIDVAETSRAAVRIGDETNRRETHYD